MRTHKQLLRDAHTDLTELQRIGRDILESHQNVGYVDRHSLLDLEKALAVPASHWTRQYDKKEPKNGA